MNALAFYAGIGPDYHTNSEIAALLIKAGARVNVKDKEGKTALMYAAEGFPEEEAVKAVELLIKAGTDINAKDKQGNTALDYASCNVYEESNEKVIELLRNAMNKK